MNELAIKFNSETPETYIPTEIEEKVARLLTETKGNVSKVAERYGSSRWNIYLHLKRSPFLQYVFKDAREKRIDFAESKLDEAVARGEPWAIALTLKTLGKERGYVERFDNTGSIEHRHSIEDWKEEANKKLKELQEQSDKRNKQEYE